MQVSMLTARSPPTRGNDRRGAMAQLVAHLLCKQGVRGSSPLGSTYFPLSSRFCHSLPALSSLEAGENQPVQRTRPRLPV
jgi:hypothetical protein